MKNTHKTYDMLVWQEILSSFNFVLIAYSHGMKDLTVPVITMLLIWIHLKEESK